MSNCPICEKHKYLNTPIFEDKHWIITHGPIESQILGYLFLEPKRHIENWSDFSEDELANIGVLFKKVEIALKKELNIDRVYLVTISEAVRHLHFHVIPREVQNNEVKSINLIEQATQQVVKTVKRINEEEYLNLIKSLKSYLM